MKISGTTTLSADRATVWQALNDPSVLVATIPGCQRLEALGVDAYKMTVAAGVGSIKGVYDGEVRLFDHQEPSSFTMRAQGAGAPGTIGAEVMVTLAEAPHGGTHLTYDADAVVGGMIGGVGQRMLTGVSKKMADEFFRNVDSVLAAGGALTGAALTGAALTGGAPQPAGWPAGAGAEGVGAPASAGAPAAGAVFTAPRAAPTGSAGSLGFALGVAAGAAAALVGALVGGWIAGRRR